MIEWGIEQKDHPVAIRVPNGNVITTGVSVEPDFGDLNVYEKTIQGNEGCNYWTWIIP